MGKLTVGGGGAIDQTEAQTWAAELRSLHDWEREGGGVTQVLSSHFLPQCDTVISQ